MSTIKVDGQEYELPTRVKLGEAWIMEKYAEGHMVEGSEEGYGVAKLMGLIHVAVRRVRPELSFDEIRERIEDLELDELGLEGDASPPVSASASGERVEPSSESSEATSDISQENGKRGSSGALTSGTTSTFDPETSKR